MKQGWLISALAALAVTTAPAWAEEKTPEADTPKPDASLHLLRIAS